MLRQSDFLLTFTNNANEEQKISLLPGSEVDGEMKGKIGAQKVSWATASEASLHVSRMREASSAERHVSSTWWTQTLRCTITVNLKGSSTSFLKRIKQLTH
ncbi:hypothetical protein GN244_ATG11380 [Phytophthora infestans]|uniref:Uncharacterized protein n=1 Tax=Phytophthora infestans TaxID=4787 RepID=A0A833SQF4_PHYIN|nr:hypothetical protein GN244_ATG11380 [Phytophthora infestans]